MRHLYTRGQIVYAVGWKEIFEARIIDFTIVTAELKGKNNVKCDYIVLTKEGIKQYQEFDLEENESDARYRAIKKSYNQFFGKSIEQILKDQNKPISEFTEKQAEQKLKEIEELKTQEIIKLQ